MGTLIPGATFVCPVLCILILNVVLRQCGSRIAWAWYGAVAILGALLAPDKEAAALFAFLGYYPILKPVFDGKKLSWLWKLVFFQLAIGVMYSLLIFVFGMQEMEAEFREAGIAMGIATLLLGNFTFFMLDWVISRFNRIRKQNGKRKAG